MSDDKRTRQTRFAQFTERGGISLGLAAVIAPFVIYVFRHVWGFDWPMSALLGVLASAIVGHALLCLVALPLFLLWMGLFHRGLCPNCQRKGLHGKLCRSDPEFHGDDREVFFSECDYCHHQFRQFRTGDESVIHITPEDERYIRTT